MNVLPRAEKYIFKQTDKQQFESPKNQKHPIISGVFSVYEGESVRDGRHQRVLRLGHVQSGALSHDGAVGLHQHGVGLVARDGLPLIVHLLVQADVVGALVRTLGVDTAQRLGIFEVQGNVNVRSLARKIEHTNSLVADKLTLDCVTHIAVGNQPDLFPKSAMVYIPPNQRISVMPPM